MKITNKRLKRIIKEEIAKVLKEGPPKFRENPDSAFDDLPPPSTADEPKKKKPNPCKDNGGRPRCKKGADCPEAAKMYNAYRAAVAAAQKKGNKFASVALAAKYCIAREVGSMVYFKNGVAYKTSAPKAG